MTRHKVSLFIPVGMILLSIGLMFHNFFRGNFSDFVTGTLVGMSLPMMIAGLVKQRRGTMNSHENCN